ncbi:MAG: hypothetical protein HYW70_02240 [Candidatus Nealsonbacteria bacterium]|nr:hypothetical protein [Candidatus Nealsonbacteria bacterium]
MRTIIQSFFVSLIAVLAVFLFFTESSLAKTDLSITATDITFSKEDPLDGENVRVFARVFNLGDTDVYGFVVFLDGKREMAGPQPISVKANTYDDVFIDWEAASGSHNIDAKIIGTNLADENSSNDVAKKENYFVDLDTDRDGKGNIADQDDDNDGLSDNDEIAIGTNPLVLDTDGDLVKDGIDLFPLDKSEWRDSDQDGSGDNKDLDDDNDNLPDKEEIFVFGTNPLNRDSDQDNISDDQEVILGTNPVKKDTDGDGVADSEDDFPLDPTRFQASILEAIGALIKKEGLARTQLFIGFSLFSAIFLFLFFYRRRKIQ